MATRAINTDMMEQATEHGISASLRPTSFSGYIGQKKVCDTLKVYIAAAKKRGECVDHILLYGPPGLGKTTLARVIANESGSSFKMVSAPSLEKAGDLVGVLAGLQENDCLFIDEIHRLPRVMEEILYSAMEDYCVSITVGRAEQTRVVDLKLPRFTLIGATTRAGMLTAPLRDRFGIINRMEFYTPRELSMIVARSAGVLSINLSPEALMVIASASRGTPRIANRYLKRIRDYAQVESKDTVEEKDAAFYLRSMDVREDGLTALDMSILSALSRNGGKPVGLSTLASMIGEEEGTITDIGESYLIYRGYIQKTPKGRVLTKQGLRILKELAA